MKHVNGFPLSEGMGVMRGALGAASSQVERLERAIEALRAGDVHDNVVFRPGRR